MNSRNGAETTSRDIRAPGILARRESPHSMAAFSQRYSSHPLHVDRSVSGPVKVKDSCSMPTTSSIVTEFRVNVASLFDISLSIDAHVDSIARALEHGHRTGGRGGVRFALEHGGVL